MDLVEPMTWLRRGWGYWMGSGLNDRDGGGSKMVRQLIKGYLHGSRLNTSLMALDRGPYHARA